MRRDTLLDLGVVAAVAVVMWAVLRTRAGLSARAVVERRPLAELAAINADRVSGVAWVTGSFLAGLAGILLSPTIRLDPYDLLSLNIVSLTHVHGIQVNLSSNSLAITTLPHRLSTPLQPSGPPLSSFINPKHTACKNYKPQ